jgi:hypothetical protein
VRSEGPAQFGQRAAGSADVVALDRGALKGQRKNDSKVCTVSSVTGSAIYWPAPECTDLTLALGEVRASALDTGIACSSDTPAPASDTGASAVSDAALEAERPAQHDASIPSRDSGQAPDPAEIPLDAAPSKPAWDGRYPDVPAGYPPASCIPPCIWELFVECGMPGGGSPPPSPENCVAEEDADSCLEACDGSYLARRGCDGGSAIEFYRDGTLCFRIGVPEGSNLPPIIGSSAPTRRVHLTNASSEVIAELADGDLGQATAYCGPGRGDPASIPYPYNLRDDGCAEWRSAMIFPLDANCASGTCEAP